MSGDDLTIVILREIRDEIRSTRIDLGSRIDATNARIDDLGSRIDVTNQRIDVVNQHLKPVADNITLLATQQIVTNRHVGNASARHDEAIEDLRNRVDKLEKSP